MIKKIVITLLIGLIIIFGFILVNRYKAKVQINDYMNKQGIKKEDIIIQELKKDWTLGGYNLFLVLNDDYDVYYEYHCEKNRVSFQAYYSRKVHLLEGKWGGSGLTSEEMKKLKYPQIEK
ncbi:DUF3139 domain-containing protein [Carnobacterium divergens]|uniref:DUF3139 domain-containing protein n=1 Tax=Carnobacterium divergens TaxID=2748 RepID=UPI0039B10312